jgi:hypothetical protein
VANFSVAWVDSALQLTRTTSALTDGSEVAVSITGMTIPAQTVVDAEVILARLGSGEAESAKAISLHQVQPLALKGSTVTPTVPEISALAWSATATGTTIKFTPVGNLPSGQQVIFDFDRAMFAIPGTGFGVSAGGGTVASSASPKRVVYSPPSTGLTNGTTVTITMPSLNTTVSNKTYPVRIWRTDYERTVLTVWGTVGTGTDAPDVPVQGIWKSSNVQNFTNVGETVYVLFTHPINATTSSSRFDITILSETNTSQSQMRSISCNNTTVGCTVSGNLLTARVNADNTANAVPQLGDNTKKLKAVVSVIPNNGGGGTAGTTGVFSNLLIVTTLPAVVPAVTPIPPP